MTAKVRDWGNIPKYFLQTIIQKPLVRIGLHLNEVWHLQNFSLMGITHSHTVAYFYRTYSVFLHRRFTP